MNKFTFICEDTEDGSRITVEFETTCWPDSFPQYLNLLRGAGYVINDNVTLNAPSMNSPAWNDREYMTFYSDSPVKQTTLPKIFDIEHSEYWTDADRNK